MARGYSDELLVSEAMAAVLWLTTLPERTFLPMWSPSGSSWGVS